MDKEVERTYELFLGRYVVNDGRIAQVIKYGYQCCGPMCTTGLKSNIVMFCTNCKHNNHKCHIDYRTGFTIERGDLEDYHEELNEKLLQEKTQSSI